MFADKQCPRQNYQAIHSASHAIIILILTTLYLAYLTLLQKQAPGFLDKSQIQHFGNHCQQSISTDSYQ